MTTWGKNILIGFSPRVVDVSVGVCDCRPLSLCIRRLIYGEFIQTLGVSMHSCIPDGFLTHGQPSSTQTHSFSQLSWNEAEFLYLTWPYLLFFSNKMPEWSLIAQERCGKYYLFNMEVWIHMCSRTIPLKLVSKLSNSYLDTCKPLPTATEQAVIAQCMSVCCSNGGSIWALETRRGWTQQLDPQCVLLKYASCL